MEIITMHQITKSYGKTQALKGIDLSVREGDIYGFIGVNGAGKSTAIRILMGLLKPDGGHASVLGGDPFTDCVAIHRRLAYVPSDVTLWGNLSGGEVIDMIAGMRGTVNHERRSALLERFSLDPSKKCRSYSKGNRQKVALISALVSDVELYIFDEPTSGLDPWMEMVFQECIRDLAAKGRTVFLSSHILSEVESICSRISIIRDGAIVESGSLREMTRLSHLCVKAECAGSLSGLSLKGAFDCRTEGGTIHFRILPEDLNEAMKQLTGLGILSMQCVPPTLEEMFLHYYEKNSGEDTYE